MNAFNGCHKLQLVKIPLTHQQFLKVFEVSSAAFNRVSPDCEFQFTDRTIKLKDIWEN